MCSTNITKCFDFSKFCQVIPIAIASLKKLDINLIGLPEIGQLFFAGWQTVYYK